MQNNRPNRSMQQVRTLLQTMGRSIDEARTRRLGPDAAPDAAAEATAEAKKIKGVKGDVEAQWKTLAADFLKASEELAKVAEKEDHTASKEAHQLVKKSCSSCHEVFRVEED